MVPENESQEDARHAELAAAGAEAVPPNEAPADLRAECERLRQEVRRLEQELDASRRECQNIQAERDGYRRMAYDVARKQFEERLPLTDEELRRLLAAEPWPPLEDLLDELERNTNGS